MNTTTALCGHSVAAVGAPGSIARKMQESMMCAACVLGQTRSMDSTPVMPSVTIPLAALRGVLTDVRYAMRQVRILHDNHRALDALERVEAEIDGWLRLARDEQPEAGQ